MSSNLTQLGKTLTQNTNSLRNATGVTKAELSAFSGLSESTIYRIETARKARRTYNPMLSTVVKLAELAGVTIDDYLKTRLNFV